MRETVLSIVHAVPYDLILTHGPRGEYTRHRRHEETCRAVVGLWADGAAVEELLAETDRRMYHAKRWRRVTAHNIAELHSP